MLVTGNNICKESKQIIVWKYRSIAGKGITEILILLQNK